MNKIYILLFVFASSVYGDLYDVFNNPFNWPPLHYAISIDDDESAIYCIDHYPRDLDRTTGGFYDNNENKCYPPFTYHLGETALEIALRKGKVDLFKKMVDKGANLNFKRITFPETFPGEGKLHTALSIALEEDNRELIIYLKEKGFDFNLCFATTLTTKSIYNDYCHKLKWKNAFEMASIGQLAFILEVVYGNEPTEEVIELFKDSRPLHKAFEEGNLEKAILAFEYGADPYAEYPKSLLTMALEKEDQAFLLLLIENKLYLGEIYTKAIKEHNDNLLNILFSKGLFADNILIETIRSGDLEMVQKLVENGFKDDSALPFALEHKKYSIALFLYEQGFAFNGDDYAWGYGKDFETMEFFLDNHFPVNINETHLDATLYGNNLMLLKRYYELGYKFDHVKNAILRAISKNHADIIDFLLQKHSMSVSDIDECMNYALFAKADRRIVECLSKAYPKGS